MSNSRHPSGPSSSGEIESLGELYRLSLIVQNNAAGLVELGVGSIDAQFAIHKDLSADVTRFEEFFEAQDHAEERRTSLEHLLPEWVADDTWEMSIDILPNRDWQEAWKEHFHTERISSRIIVKPSWEQFTAGDNDCVVEIDPGMSFGTGQHPTTRACLRFIDQLAPKEERLSFLDLGCGSGILAITAAKLGFSNVSAIDMDPVAVRMARENAALNDVIDLIDFQEADIRGLEADLQFDVVGANLFATLLTEQAEMISKLMAPRCALVLAGLLSEQYAAVRDCYERRGFEEQESATEEEWTSGWFRRGTSE
jgi:ribosomal protein L11 methyltransferase